jgi:hypothetical protein
LTQAERTARPIVVAASSFAVAGVLTYLIFVWTAFGQFLDAAAFDGNPAGGDSLAAILLRGLRTGVIIALASVALVAGVVAIIHRRWRATSIALLLVTSSVTLARLLRLILERPDLGDYAYHENTLPSGHVAAATSLVVAIGILLPVNWRGRILTALAVITVTAAGAASFLTLAHRPSDVIAAILLVGVLGSILLPLAGLTPRPRVTGVAVVLLCLISLAAMVSWFIQLLHGFGAPDPRFPLAPLGGIVAATLWVTLVLIVA